MTGQKNRFKMDDEDFNDPTHDEIIIRLLYIDNLKALIPEVSLLPDQIKWITQTHRTDRRYELIQLKKIDINYFYIEKMETGKYNRTFKLVKETISIKSEVPIMRARTCSILGYFDIVFEREGLLKNEIAGNRKIRSALYIKVKSKIRSFGETLRQLKTYETYQAFSKGNIYLVTPDLKFKEAFESQGVHVISP
jgi:hypothetical protein